MVHVKQYTHMYVHVVSVNCIYLAKRWLGLNLLRVSFSLFLMVYQHD